MASSQLQHKRLFIGGLNSGTTEQDIRERFKTFGNVSSVELHKVHKREGFSEKTFAYIDLESSETNIKRCISMLSNTKWRGGILKIEPAKESFLSRLRKEREQVAAEITKSTTNESQPVLPKELMEPVRNAVPGTQLPGQRNWVVGKFGRALPVVHMRPKHGRKIMKFDPSKTVHNLKRIKEENDDNNVSELTWNLESRGCYPWDVNKIKKSQNDFDSSSSNEISEDDINHKSKEKAKLPKKKKSYVSGKVMKQVESQEYYPLKETDSNGNLKKWHAKDVENESMSDSEDTDNKPKMKKTNAGDDSSTKDELDNCIQGDLNYLDKTKKKLKEKKKDKMKEGKKDEISIDAYSDKTVCNKASIQNDKDIQEIIKRKRERRMLSDDDNMIYEPNIKNESDFSDHIENGKEKRKKKRKDKNAFKQNVDSSMDKSMETGLSDVDMDGVKQTDKKKSKQKTTAKKEQEFTTEDSEQSLPKVDEETIIHDKKSKQKGKKKTKKSKEMVSFTEEVDDNEAHFSSKQKPSDESEESVIVGKRNKHENHNNKKSILGNNTLVNGEVDSGVKKEQSNTKTILPNEKMLKTNNSSSSNKNTNSPKKVTSNEKRLKAIQDREVNTSTKQSIISTALQNIDKNDKSESLKHIKFDDNEDRDGRDDEEQEKTVSKRQRQEKISGTKASNWLGLDSDSDDSADKETFDAKPQFEGKSGHKLFQLQKTFRGDSRFQLDKRFIDSDDDDDNDEGDDRPVTREREDDADDIIDEDELTKQLSQEKNMEMSVLQGILGVNFGSKYNSSAQKHTIKDSGFLRYDPTREDHAQYEETPKKNSVDDPAIEESQPTTSDDMRNDVPEVAVDKYYDVKTDALTEMFSGKKKEEAPSTFTFLSTQDDEEEPSSPMEWGQTEELKSKPWNPVMLPYDSSGDEQEQDDIEETSQKDDHSLPDERFFFHFGDLELESTVYDQEQPFMRTMTLEELNEHWVKVRSELTQDYKKKHKDAMRRHSKMAAKRARTR